MNFNRPVSLRQSGLSLMELMIAITIGFIVVAGVGYLYLGSRQTFKTQDSLSTIQENSRFALDTMSSDIRMAGYMGCGNLSGITPVNITQNPQIATPTGLQVFPGGSGWTVPASYTRVAGDVLRISHASSSGVTLTGNMTVANANIQLNGNPGNFKAGDVLMVSDCQHADVFVANNVSSGSVTIAHSNSVNTTNFLSQAYGMSPPPAQVYTFQQIDYFVGCPTASWAGGQCSVPVALYQIINNGVPQALVDNVENMAFLLGVDTSGTVPPAKVVGAYQTPTVVAAANNWANVLTVQAHLLMVGGPANDSGSNVTVASQAYTFNSVAYPADRRLRQEAIATIAIRNRLP